MQLLLNNFETTWQCVIKLNDILLNLIFIYLYVTFKIIYLCLYKTSCKPYKPLNQDIYRVEIINNFFFEFLESFLIF